MDGLVPLSWCIFLEADESVAMLIQLEQHCMHDETRCIRVNDGNEARVDDAEDDGTNECSLLLVGPCEDRSMSLSR